MTAMSGVLEPTDRTLDVGIAGSGFFMVQDGSQELYTRAGNFQVNSEGLLVDQNGFTVMGFSAANPTTLSTINMTEINSVATPTTKVALTGNLDAGWEIGTIPTAPLTMSEVSNAAAFSNPIKAYDTLGQGHDILVSFTKTASLTWTAQAYIEGSDVSGGQAGDPPKLIGTQAGIQFDSSGDIIEGSAPLSISVNYANGAAAGALTVDFSGLTEFSAGSIVTGVVNDGQPTGNIQSYEIDRNGGIFALLDSGPRKEVGTIGVRTFINTDGLERAGSALFTYNLQNGANEVGTAGEAGRGVVQSGFLEHSTVDLSDQFVQLVLYQRGYQASSQTLSAANGLLRDTLGLIR